MAVVIKYKYNISLKLRFFFIRTTCPSDVCTIKLINIDCKLCMEDKVKKTNNAGQFMFLYLMGG